MESQSLGDVAKKRVGRTADDIARTQKLAQLSDKDIINVDVRNLLRDENVRRTIKRDDEHVQLMATIKKVGLQQPLVVEVAHDRLRLVSGHRRVEALLDLGEFIAPAVVREFEGLGEPGLKIIAQLAENMNRKELAPLDIADACAKLKKCGYEDKVIASYFKLTDVKYVRRITRMAHWPKQARKIIQAKEDTGKPIPMRKLYQIAAKAEGSVDITSEVKIAAGEKKRDPKPKPTWPKTPAQWQQKLDVFIKKQDYQPTELAIIRQFVKDIRLGEIKDL